MDVDPETKGKLLRSFDMSFLIQFPTEEAEQLQVDNPALTTPLKAVSSLTREQKAALSRTLERCLAPPPTDPHPNPHARTVISEAAWDNRANWGRDEWNPWETWGWYRQLCRVVRLSFLFTDIVSLQVIDSMLLIYAPNRRR